MGSNKDKNKKDTKIIDTKLRTAMDLYSKAKMEIFDDSLPDPGFWILNKDKLKNGWAKYMDKANSTPNILKMAMLNNSFGHYMQYMHDNF